MIIPLPNTTIAQILKELQRARDEGGAVALGRVLTLVITTTDESEEQAISAANEASREHPMRIIVLTTVAPGASGDILDAEIRLGGDAGASEVIILRAAGAMMEDPQGLINGLLLPDAPMVAWWPDSCPEDMSLTSLGQVAGHRIADTISATNPLELLDIMTRCYRPGDVDLAWTRITLWRAQLAATLDSSQHAPILSARVSGARDSSSPILLAAWLRAALGVPVTLDLGEENAMGSIMRAEIVREDGSIVLERTEPGFARLLQPGQPDHVISLPLRTLGDCIAEELRRLDPDMVFGRVLSQGMPALLAENPGLR
ncbi:glucose-6-phosphate dehydrogenase assembly protein OpcA [Microbacteriaceae bacterium MWH-Ta3]|nr:glucose-6-phosphate dehydrogenase assembly protein OpcA [Microbacteriaceae bacterium MWH-Ta3]